MKHLLWVIPLLCAAAVAQYNGNAPVVVQSYIEPACCTAVGTLTFNNPVTTGNVEFVCTTVDRGIGGTSGGPYTISSLQVASWTSSTILHYTAPGINHSFDYQCHHGTVTGTGTETVTLSGGGGAFITYEGTEVANIVDTVDVSGNNLDSSTQPPNISVALTTTIDGDFILAGSATSLNGQCVVGSVNDPSEKIAYGFEGVPVNFAGITQAIRTGTHGSYTVTRNNLGCGPGNSLGNGLAMWAFAFKPVSSGVKVASTQLADANLLNAYGGCLTSLGGSGTKTWTVSAGSLPTGISLSSGGCFSGTPTTVGTSTFTVQVTDVTSATQVLTLKVIPAASAPTVVQVVPGTANLSATLTSVTAGDAILVLMQGFDTHGAGGWLQPLTGGSNNISDTSGNTYVRICPGADGMNAPMTAAVAKANGSGSVTVTFNQTPSASNLTWFLLDITGSPVIDCGVGTVGTMTANTSITLSKSITTVVPNTLLVAMMSGAFGLQSESWGGGFGSIATASFGTASAYGSVATSLAPLVGTYTPSDLISFSGSTNWIGGMMVFGIRPDSLAPTGNPGDKIRRRSW